MGKAATELREMGMKPTQLQKVLDEYANKKEALTKQVPKIMDYTIIVIFISHQSLTGKTVYFSPGLFE
jgi:hypothetical protein